MASDNGNKQDPYANLQQGDRVKHATFGEGQIIARSGSGDETKLLVKFAEEGEKRLVARFAKLKKVQVETARPAPEPEPEDETEDEDTE